jgi:N-acetylneuraminic acid mutarotase
MARDTKQPEVLRELFEALRNDPFVIAECLARPTLVERDFAIAESHTSSREESRAKVQPKRRYVPNANYALPAISDATTGCTLDTWTNTSTANAPAKRRDHTAVWTGSEMIVWGGFAFLGVRLNTGGRYNPSTDTWAATTNAPPGRTQHTAIWTGSEMVVWGGFDGSSYLNTGARYNPTTDSWTVTSTINAASARNEHTAVWTGSEMIVWGGFSFDGTFHWWNTGSRYNPGADSWTAVSTTNAPEGRYAHTAVWTGSEMVVWGGVGMNGGFNTGGKYNPGTDSWIATSITNVPTARQEHTAVWTGSEMIIWGGAGEGGNFITGGRYCAQSSSATPTPTPTATATPTATPTPTPTPTPCIGRCTPTPRPRPTPAPRP